GAAIALRAGPAAGSTASARGRRFHGADRVVCEQLGVCPHAGDGPVQPSPHARAEPATSRAGEGLPAAAEFLLAAKLVCPLGGQYVYREAAAGEGRWTATTLEEFQPKGGLMAAAPP